MRCAACVSLYAQRGLPPSASYASLLLALLVCIAAGARAAPLHAVLHLQQSKSCLEIYAKGFSLALKQPHHGVIPRDGAAVWVGALSLSSCVSGHAMKEGRTVQCPKVRWRQCEACQRRIQEEGLEDEFHLQSWFVGRINTFLKAQGRVLIGWDEILEGGLSPGAVVMSWRVRPSSLLHLQSLASLLGLLPKAVVPFTGAWGQLCVQHLS